MLYAKSTNFETSVIMPKICTLRKPTSKTNKISKHPSMLLVMPFNFMVANVIHLLRTVHEVEIILFRSNSTTIMNNKI